MAEYLPNERSRPLSRFSIYNKLSTNEKRAEEARELTPFLLKMDQFVDFRDVDYADDPPDFVFRDGNHSIGVELTAVNPALFGEGGYRRKKAFREWKSEIKANPRPEHVFEWGKFTLRESLSSLKHQFETKSSKAKLWNNSFSEKWLLLHLARGSPFGTLVATSQTPVPEGNKEQINDQRAKTLFEVSSILRAPNPFDCILMLSGCQMIAFPTNGRNPHKFPTPRWDMLTRGAQVSDSHLEWTSELSHVVRHNGDFSS